MKDLKDELWVEKYRPDSLETYIGNEHILERFDDYIDKQLIPHLLFAGKPGIGKTTIAKILIKQIKCDYIFLNASDENSIDVIRGKIKDFVTTVSLNGLKIVVLDEFDFLSKNAMAALKNIIETYSTTCRFILTCNQIEKVNSAIISRCQLFSLETHTKKDLAKLLVRIFRAENINFTKEDIHLIINASYPDIRKTIGFAQSNVFNGELKFDTENIIKNDYIDEIIELLSNTPNNNFYTLSRNIIANSKAKDFSDLYTALFYHVDKFGKGQETSVIPTIAKFAYESEFVIDKEITTMALLLQLYKIVNK